MYRNVTSAQVGDGCSDDANVTFSESTLTIVFFLTKCWQIVSKLSQNANLLIELDSFPQKNQKNISPPGFDRIT